MSLYLNQNHPVTYSNLPVHLDEPVEVHEDVETRVVILNQDGTLSEESMFPGVINLETIEDLSVNHDIVSLGREMDSLSSPCAAPSSLSSCPPHLQQSLIAPVYTTILSSPGEGSPRHIPESEIKIPIVQNFNSLSDHNYTMSSLVDLPSLKRSTLQTGTCLQYNNNNEGLPFIKNFSWKLNPTSLDTIESKSQVSSENRKSLKSGGVKFASKIKSFVSLGQVLQEVIPKEPKPRSVQACPLCNFEAATKNPYRHLQDHLARVHFKKRLAQELPSGKPYICPVPSCGGKQFPDWQAVMRHYIGNKHGVLQKFVKEWQVSFTS